MNKLKYLIDCSWGLCLLDIFTTGNTSALMWFKRQAESLGLRAGIRVYVDMQDGLTGTSPVFWRGASVLEEVMRRKFTPKVQMDLCAKYNVGILPVVSTFNGQTMPRYNAARMKEDQRSQNVMWKTIVDRWGHHILACQVDNEPLSGAAKYTKEEYTHRAHLEASYIKNDLGYQPITTLDTRYSWEDEHFAIGRDTHDFPSLPRLDCVTEAWERPTVEGGYFRYAEWIKQHKNLKLVAFNLGGNLVPKTGLKWGNSRYKTFLWDTLGPTTTADAVFKVLSKQPAPPINPPVKPPVDTEPVDPPELPDAPVEPPADPASGGGLRPDRCRTCEYNVDHHCHGVPPHMRTEYRVKDRDYCSLWKEKK